MSDLEAALAERNRALLALDVEWVKNQLRKDWPSYSIAPDATLLITIHKARVECVALPERARKESAIWLKDRGHLTMTGQMPDPENLPT